VAEAEADGVADAAPTMLAAPDPPAQPVPPQSGRHLHRSHGSQLPRRIGRQRQQRPVRPPRTSSRLAAPLHPLIQPLPRLREDSTSRIFAFVDDLFFAAKFRRPLAN